MSRRTRRRLTSLASLLVVGAVFTWTQNTWAAATVGAAVLLLGLIRPPKRRPRHRRRTPPARVRTAAADTRPHVLYRVYDHTGQLIYIGVCVTHPGRDIHDRVREHARTQPWWHEVARVDAYETHPSRAAAFTAEKNAIDTAEAAGIRLYNRVHNEHWQPYHATRETP